MENNNLAETPNLNADDILFIETIEYPNIKSVCTLFFVYLFYTLIGGILLGIILATFDGFHINTSLSNSVVNLLGYVIMMLMLLRYAIKKANEQQAITFKATFAKFQSWLIPVIILSALAMVIGLERMANLIPMPKIVEKFFLTVFKKDVISILNIVIVAPIFEEILCRGIVLRGLLKNYKPYKAIIISALFFAAIHLNPWQALPAFFGGLFMGWLYYKTRSVIPGIIAHAINNLTASIFLFLPQKQQGFSQLTGVYYIPVCIISIIIFVFGCIIINKRAVPLVS